MTVVESGFQRRDVLKLALGGAAGSLTALSNGPSFGQTDTPAAPPAVAPPPVEAIVEPNIALGPPVAFGPGSVSDLARSLAKQPFKPVKADLPDALSKLTPDQYATIHVKPEGRIWSTQSLGFAIEPLQRGSIFPNPVDLYIVAQGQAHRLVYNPNLVDFGIVTGSVTPAKVGDIGFSGFRVLGAQDNRGFAEVASFQGANFFRALAKGQVPGIVARALAVRLADPKGEDVPIFRALWIEKPSLVANALVVHAVIDSETMTGAFRFTLRPGEATIIDTESILFARTAVDNVGIGTMSATHLLGFMDRRQFDDYRPNVHEVCGLQMYTGSGEWIWRPVTNRETLQVSTFVDQKPRGFGFLLRDRDFDDYADEDQHWERRPSLWIEPLGEWSPGGVQLIEIPSESEANDNILCYWRPQQPLAAGSETSFAYRQFWCWNPPEQPDLARTVTSRSGRGGGKTRRRFLIHFAGDILARSDLNNGLKPTLTTSAGKIASLRMFVDDDKKSVRVLFEMDFGSEQSAELRLVLEAQGKPLTESWLYRWTPV